MYDFRNQKVTVFKSNFDDGKEIDCTTVKKTFNSNEIVIHYKKNEEMGKAYYIAPYFNLNTVKWWQKKSISFAPKFLSFIPW